MTDENLDRDAVEETGDAPADTEAPHEETGDAPALPEHDKADSAEGTDV